MARYPEQKSAVTNPDRSGLQRELPISDASCDLVDERDALIQQLREAVAARDNFLAIAAHELRSPLTAIQARLELMGLAERSGDYERMAGQLAPLAAVIDQFAKRTELVLNTAQLNTGKLPLEFSRFDLTKIVTGVLESYSPLLKRRGSALTARLEPELFVWLDERATIGIVENLLSNAIKYGQGKPVEVTSRSLEHQVLISVRDHGIGIAPAHTQRIFERFERAVGPLSRQGFGIGLWVSRNFVDAMGGSIHVTSRTGAGSLFTVKLPIDGRRSNER
jgi:two-component system OmpR family sensor kinase